MSENLHMKIIKAIDPGLGRTIDDYGLDYVKSTWPHVLEDIEKKIDRLAPLFEELGSLPPLSGCPSCQNGECTAGHGCFDLG